MNRIRLEHLGNGTQLVVVALAGRERINALYDLTVEAIADEPLQASWLGDAVRLTLTSESSSRRLVGIRRRARRPRDPDALRR